MAYHEAVNNLLSASIKALKASEEDAEEEIPVSGRHMVDDNYAYYYDEEPNRHRVGQPTSHPTPVANQAGCFYAATSLTDDDGPGSHRPIMYCPNGWTMLVVWFGASVSLLSFFSWFFTGKIFGLF